MSPRSLGPSKKSRLPAGKARSAAGRPTARSERKRIGAIAHKLSDRDLAYVLANRGHLEAATALEQKLNAQEAVDAPAQTGREDGEDDSAELRRELRRRLDAQEAQHEELVAELRRLREERG